MNSLSVPPSGPLTAAVPLVFLFRRQRKNAPRRNKIPPSATPTPIPAFAPVDNPDGGGGVVFCAVVCEAWAPVCVIDSNVVVWLPVLVGVPEEAEDGKMSLPSVVVAVAVSEAKLLTKLVALGTKKLNPVTPLAEQRSDTNLKAVSCSSAGHEFAAQDPMYPAKDVELQIHFRSSCEQPPVAAVKHGC